MVYFSFVLYKLFPSNSLKTEKAIHTKNYLTEYNNPNLITGNTQTNENEDVERNRLLYSVK